MSESRKNYAIYQLKHMDELVPLRFMNLSFLTNRGKSVEGKNYDKVYSGTLSDRFTDVDSQLEAFYIKFNKFHPEDFKGHSLSVSDVVVIENEGKACAYYCDSIGFKEVPQFFDSLPEKAKPSLADQIQGAQAKALENEPAANANEKSQEPSL